MILAGMDEEQLDHEVALLEGDISGKKYSTDWNIAGGLIVREKIGFYPSGIGIGGIARTWMATIAVPKHLRTSNRMEHYKAQGRTPLIAAMRVYLKSKGFEND